MNRSIASHLQLLGTCCVMSAVIGGAPQPLARAESGPTPTSPGPTAASAAVSPPAASPSYEQTPQNQTRVPEAIEAAPSPSGTSPGRANVASQGASAAIDPQQIQQVFGEQASVIDLKSLDRSELEALQRRLEELGYYRAKVDGLMGPQTRAALAALARAQASLEQRLLHQDQLASRLAESLGMGLDIVPTSGREDDGPVEDHERSESPPAAPDSNSPATTPPNRAPSDPRPDQTEPAPLTPDRGPYTPPYDYPDTPSRTPGQGETTPHG